MQPNPPLRSSGRRTALCALSLAALVLVLCVAPASAGAGEKVHKIIAPPHTLTAGAGITIWQDYGSFALYRVSETALARLPQSLRDQVWVADQMDRLLIDASPFDTQSERPKTTKELAVVENGPGLHLVQFVGPIKQEWLNAVQATGARLVHYIANNGYLVWADGNARQALTSMAQQGQFLQYSGAFEPIFKLGPTLRARLDRNSDPNEVVAVTIQMYRHEDKGATEELIDSLKTERLSPWQSILAYQNITVKLHFGDVTTLALRPDVNWIGERLPRRLYDEVQGQIVAGNFDGGMTGPSGPGYLAFLSGLGFSTTQADYPIVDVTDDGIGNGTVNSGDSVMHEGGSLANPTRLAYVSNCTAAATGEGVDGHGHLNTSIVGGYDSRTGFPFQDADGFNLGLGLNPYGRMAGTRVFAPGFDESACGGTDTGMIKHIQDMGAKINSNSWGCSGCAGTYDDSSQAYDVGTRDADLGEAGNQQLIEIFAAGNAGSGAGTVGTPGNGKNMITVGASENDRPTWTDGCGVGPTGADNAMDVIDFSSRGPSPGGRVKPEVIAPGTHIQGTASTNAGYTGNSVCDQFHPTGQTTFAASSGTSHSTPAIAGVASLIYKWLQDNYSISPSPAMEKAYMIAHPTYLTGVGANDTLPSNSQGYGQPTLNKLFDSASKFLLDQTVILDNTGDTYTWSGSTVDNAKPVRIVLVWTDKAGAIGTSPQVNDLNLSATVAGNAYLGNHFSGQFSTTGGSADNVNNYEAIFLPAGTAGAIDITVTGFNIADDGVPNTGDTTDQDFALVCYNCAQEPTFTLGVTPSSQDVCAPADANYTVDIGSILGFTDPVTLSASGNPTGSTVAFGTNPVTPPNTTMMTIGNTGGATLGSSTITVTGTSGMIVQNKAVGLRLFNAAAGTSTLLTPTNGAINVALQPNFTWSAASQAASYEIQVATDNAFSNIVASASGLAGTTYSPAPLASNSIFYWRVRATNPCGTGSYSSTFSFQTLPLPGDCPLGSAINTLFSDNFESGAPGWTHSGTQDSWALTTARNHSATHSYEAMDFGSVSDQRLVSPSVVLPAGQNPVTLQFWNHQTMESRTGGCYDGAILEISTNGGSTWTQITSGLLTDPYDGPVSTGFSSPIGGLNAWCGDPQDWLNSVIDLNAYAGQTVSFRFRMASDSSVSRVPDGWYLDDVKVQSCFTDLIFEDGLESGDTSHWSMAQTDGGDLSVSGAAAMGGTTDGIAAVINDTNNIFVRDDSPGGENEYHARFYFDPNGFTTGMNGQRTKIFQAFDETPQRRIVTIALRVLNGGYLITAKTKNDDDTWANTGFFTITDAPHVIEVKWKRATTGSSNDGSLQLWIDGASQATLSGLDNNTSQVDYARLGAFGIKAGSSGTLYFDEFSSHRVTYIGPLP